MKHAVLALAALLLLSPVLSQAEDTESYGTDHDKALEHFKTQEKKVKDALWTSKTMLKLGVLDDGSNRDGYAEYACTVLLDDFNFKGKDAHVQIIDIEQLVSSDKWVKLGEATCE